MSTTIKLLIGDEIRRFTIPTSDSANNVFDVVSKLIGDVFGFDKKEFKASYEDDEGDSCLVSSNEEMREALRFFESKGQTAKLRLLTKIAPKSSAANRAKEQVAAKALETAHKIEEKEDKKKPVPPPKPSAEFVADVTMPDNSIQTPGSVVRKVWSFKNNGTADWPAGCKIQYVSGGIAPNGDKKQIILIPQATAGQTVEVAVDVKIPSTPGRQKGVYYLLSNDGNRFKGHYRAWTQHVVSQQPTITKAEFLAQAPAFLEDAEVRAAIGELLSGDVIHHHHICDGCGMSPLVGIRYHCTKCPDYDLCEECEAQGKHPRDHTMLKHKSPSALPQGKKEDKKEDKKEKTNQNTTGSWRRAEEPTPTPQADAVPTPSLSSTPSTTTTAATPTKATKSKAAFVKDVTVPDGSMVESGSTVTKTWSIRNVGPSKWRPNTNLIFVGGTLEGKAKPVPLAETGETVDVSVDVVMPSTPGRCTGYYRLIDGSSGKRFGHRYWLDVNVVATTTTSPPVTAPASAPLSTTSSSPSVAPPTNATDVKIEETKQDKKDNKTEPETKAPTSASSASPIRVPRKYSTAMTYLKGMGFTDDEMLLDLLVAAKGNSNQVVAWLVNP